jgi:hypothetical protein
MWGVPRVGRGLESGMAVVGRGDRDSVVAGNVDKFVAVGFVKVADGETGETLCDAVGIAEHALRVATHKRTNRRNFCMEASSLYLSFLLAQC